MIKETCAWEWHVRVLVKVPSRCCWYYSWTNLHLTHCTPTLNLCTSAYSAATINNATAGTTDHRLRTGRGDTKYPGFIWFWFSSARTMQSVVLLSRAIGWKIKLIHFTLTAVVLLFYEKHERCRRRVDAWSIHRLLLQIFLYDHFIFPAQLVAAFTTSDLLDKPWSQVSSRLPSGTCLHFYRASVSAFPLFVDFYPNFENSRSCAFRSSVFTQGEVLRRECVHTVRTEPTKLILVGTMITYPPIGDAGALLTGHMHLVLNCMNKLPFRTSRKSML